ncbi:MAG: hypothetical protein U0930_13055 [Pirellulales bacterium]
MDRKHGDRNTLVLYEEGVSFPVPVPRAVKIGVSPQQSNETIAASVVSAISERLNTKRLPDPEFRVVVIEHSAGARGIAQKIQVELNRHSINISGNQRKIRASLLTDSMHDIQMEFPGLAGMLRLKAILNRTDFAVYVVGEDSGKASSNALGPFALGMLDGRAGLTADYFLKVRSRDNLTGPSNFSGSDWINYDECSPQFLNELLTHIQFYIRNGSRLRYDKVIQYIQGVPALQGWTFEDLTESGLDCARYPNDLLPPSLAFFAVVDKDRTSLRFTNDLFTVWDRLIISLKKIESQVKALVNDWGRAERASQMAAQYELETASIDLNQFKEKLLNWRTNLPSSSPAISGFNVLKKHFLKELKSVSSPQIAQLDDIAIFESTLKDIWKLISLLERDRAVLGSEFFRVLSRPGVDLSSPKQLLPTLRKSSEEFFHG